VKTTAMPANVVHTPATAPSGAVAYLRDLRTVRAVENTLHPNLARIAASYQQILGRHSRGEIALTIAHGEIRELVARDDEGVQWTINPRDGGWLFLSRNGQWMPADPPRSGFATITPHDLREMNNQHAVSYNPDWDITLEKAESERLIAVAAHTGARAKKRLKIVVSAAVVVLIGALVWSITQREVEEIAPGAPASTQQSQ
jgi:hypothetical protein